MKQSIKLIAVTLNAVLFSGCASIQSGTSQEIKITSNPPGATVYTASKKTKDGAELISNKVAVGVTPLSVKVSRKDGAIFLEKAGFAPAEVVMTTKINPWVWGDVLLTSPLSTSIDTSTGAANEFDPGEYQIDLKPVSK